MKNIQKDNILISPFCQEKVKVISCEDISKTQVKIYAVGIETQKFYSFIFNEEDIKNIEIFEEKKYDFSADAELQFLFLESVRIKNASQFDTLYAVNVSQIDPLPHQIEAVYYYVLKNPHIRFLLADDPGAGKTIMAGLLIKELKYRRLAERILIVVPGHLKDQWLREMKDKFQENFTIANRGLITSSWGRNIFSEFNLVIISMDFAKQDDVMLALKDSKWDLCIVDEAHKMAAYKYGVKIDKTQRYSLGECLSEISNHLLFLTATPHRGDSENFRLLLNLLEFGFFANKEILSEAIQNKENPLFLRRLKEDLKNFEGVPIFPPRYVNTIKYSMSDSERKLYNAVTEYVQKYFNRALEKDKRNVTFALTVLQRRLASSVCSIRKSLERRLEKLEKLCKTGKLLQEQIAQYDEEYLDDLEEKERWEQEEELLQKLTTAETIEELEEEIEKVKELFDIAKSAEKEEIETKLGQLQKLIENKKLLENGTKLLIFTEFRDTLEYLVEKLRGYGFSVTYIHGGMNLDSRIKAEGEFNNSSIQIMVSTEAGGEGINLQKSCWIMVNYDIPWSPTRLEQRMGRIHRYGQQHEVYIYNFVTIDTIEGKIYNVLFNKLEKIREQLGSDRVFDVIGEIIPGKSLKDLILDAIINSKNMDEILKDFEKIPDNEAIEKVKDISLEALATRHIDMTKILAEQRIAKENKLVPEYIEKFFLRLAQKLNIKIEKRQDGFWRITSIPFEIRNQNYDFKIKFGEILSGYNKVSFDKEKAFIGQAEFIAMGHPLLEAVVEKILSSYSDLVLNGSIFSDPEGNLNGLLWFVEAEIKDGKDDVAGRRLLTVYQDISNNLSPVNSSILWDLTPESTKLESSNIPQNLDKNKIISFVIKECLESYKSELLQERKRISEIKKKYGIRSLQTMINESDTKIVEYETEKMKGKNIPEVTIINEQRKKEDLERKKQILENEIEAEINLYPAEPKILGVVKVIPGTSYPELKSDKEIEKIGMEVAIAYEKENGRIPEDVCLKNLGYDIKSYDKEGNYRYIEVKARAKEGAIALTPNEWIMAQRLKEEYWLYIVTNASEKPKLYLINDPALKLKPYEEEKVVRYIIENNSWKEKAEEI